MKTLDRVLFASDFSEASTSAFWYAAHFCANIRASLTLLHVAEIPYGFTSWTEEYKERAIEEGMQFLQKKAAELKEAEKLSDLEIHCKVLTGRVSNSIMDACREGAYHLLIMSEDGKHPGKALFNNLISEITRFSPIPVLLVPAEYASYHLEQLFYTTDYNEADPEHLEQIFELSQKLAGSQQLTLLHVDQDQSNPFKNHCTFLGFERLIRQLHDEMKLADPCILRFERVAHKSFLSGLSQFLDNNVPPPHLLIVSQHRRSWFIKLFSEGNSSKIPFRFGCPILIMV